MAIQYRTEYHLGRRGRICRTYGGVAALVAIAFDLALGMVLGLLGLAFSLARFAVRATFRVASVLLGVALEIVAALVRLPFRVIGSIFGSAGRGVGAVSPVGPGHSAAKPAWASPDEL